MKDSILYIDLSSSITGITIEDVNSGETETIRIKTNQYEHITHNRHLKAQMKIKDFDEKFSKVIECLNIKEVVIEAPFVNPRFLASSESILKMHGYILYKLKDYKITYVEPKTWKKAVIGNGNACKKDSINFIQNKYNVKFEKPGVKPDDNMYDSYALYLYKKQAS